MNTVKDLRQALAEEMRRLQPSAGLESRVLHQAFRITAGIDPVRGVARRAAVRPWESRLTRPLTAGMRAVGAVAALLIVILIVVGILLGGRTLHNWGTVPAHHPSTHAIPRAESGMVTSTTGWRSSQGWRVERTTDAGAHWTDVTPQSAVNNELFASTYFLDATHAWLTEAAGFGPFKLRTARTADGGKTWDQGEAVTGVGAQDSISLYFVDAMHGWLVLAGNVMYGTKDGGLNWTSLATSATQARRCTSGAPAFASAKDGWLAQSCSLAREQPLLATHDGGITWVPQQLPLTEAGLTCPCSAGAPTIFDHEDAAVLVSGIGPAYLEPRRLFMTADGGNSWSARTLPGEDQLVVDFIDAKHGWTVAGSSDLFSRDPTGKLLSGATLPLYRTNDGGLTWTPIKTNWPSSSSADRVFNLYFVDQQNGFAERFNELTQAGQLLKTVDGGRTWSVVGPEK